MRDTNKEAYDRCLADESANKINLGIGILIGPDGIPLQSHAYYKKLHEMANHLQYDPQRGAYLKPDPAVLESAKQFLLDELCIPEEYRKLCLVNWCEGGGSGALAQAIAFAFGYYKLPKTLMVQKKGWIGYRAHALTRRLKLIETEVDFSDATDGTAHKNLLIAQLVHNRTSKRVTEDQWEALAKSRRRKGSAPVIFDIAYSGFDHARYHQAYLYTVLMASNFFSLRKFLEYGIPCMIAWSPTKTKGTFRGRPGGALVLVCQNKKDYLKKERFLTAVSRANTGFLSVATYALMRTMHDNPAELKADHEKALACIWAAEQRWMKGTEDIPSLRKYFDYSKYAGMFRTLPTKSGSLERLAQNPGYHIHTVDMYNDDIGINITGLPESPNTPYILASLAAEIHTTDK